MARERSKNDSSARRGRWTPAEKLKILSEASQLGDDKLGAYLRTQGVHEAHFVSGVKPRRPRSPH
jgi:hypothetical protein